MPVKKVLYLFGAGATHAEIMSLEADSPSALFRDSNGLLISNVSQRVIKKAQARPWFKNNEDVITSPKGVFNIELLISLFEKNGVSDSHIAYLKKLVREDIRKRLSESRKRKFYLHKGLLELHTQTKESESLLGMISLNYDDVLDEAYEKILGHRPNYCFNSEADVTEPLLKLHGSFNWTNVEIYGKRKNIPIIPIGIDKNYLAPPYNFIWGRAFELLVKCDVLRIVGCSLSQNDTGLVDLLFKAHLERGRKIDVEPIDFQPVNGHHSIRNNYGFLAGIVDPTDIENTLITDPAIYKTDVGNPFKIWLKAKAEKMLSDRVSKTTFLKKCFATL
jgi:hypothetical protein